jgi:hypothetical protein
LSQPETARSYGVSQGWISRLMARYAAEGEATSSPGIGKAYAGTYVVLLVQDLNARIIHA